MFISKYNDKMYNACCQDYMNYIDEHVNNVHKAFEKLFVNVPQERFIDGIHNNPELLKKLEEDIKHHDESKYSDKEFEGYRGKYNQTPDEKAITDEDLIRIRDLNAEEAWHHHYITNYHHPQFWLYVSIHGKDEFGLPTYWVGHPEPNPEPYTMPLIAILHMICDWEAMSMKFNTSTVKWWEEDSEDERKCMTQETIDKVNELLPLLFK